MTDIRKRLAALGLSSNEIDAYLYLIKEGSGKPTFIANSIGILRSNIYGVLDRLCEYGLVKELDGFKSKVYSAGNISESLDRLILREKEEIQRKEHIASELTGFLEGLRAGSLRNNKAVEVFEDPAHSALAIKHLFDIAKEEILSVSHPPYFSSIFNAESKETDKADEEKKGYLTDEPGDEDYRMYCIYQLEDISLDSFKEIVRSTISLGDRVRFALKAPAKMVVVDRRYAAMGLTSDTSGVPLMNTVLIHNPGIAEMLADSFHRLFDTLPWTSSGKDLEAFYSGIVNQSITTDN